MRRTILLAVAGAALLSTGVLVLRRIASTPATPNAPASQEQEGPLALSHAEPEAPEPHEAPAPSPVAGLDLVRIGTTEGTPTAPADGGTAHLTIDLDLQREALGLMGMRHLPEAAVVLMDVASGRVLVYASHVEHGAPHDLCTEATAPSASVFKIVTASALVENAHLGPETKECYSGGEQRINAIDLVEDPARDRWCTTLAGAMGRSINTVFARLAKEHLTPPQLEAMARRFGYGDALSFDVPVQPGGLHIPTEPLEFARTAAGFWNTTLSPLQAAEISAIVARDGEALRPRVVDRVVSDRGEVTWSAPDETPRRRAIGRETAQQLTTMMERTVIEGTSFRAFHDPSGGTFLPGITVAGKTGTLTEAESQRYYTWFTGFAPVHPDASARQVAIAVLVVNGPSWQVKANVLARDVLRAYFAEHGVQGVTRPSIREVARHRR
ncbi:MAG TPA: penicillin-binding transpeptidase domain-containing protein [Polyangiaceae bacterium]